VAVVLVVLAHSIFLVEQVAVVLLGVGLFHNLLALLVQAVLHLLVDILVMATSLQVAILPLVVVVVVVMVLQTILLAVTA
jgi:hypothetical protein